MSRLTAARRRELAATPSLLMPHAPAAATLHAADGPDWLIAELDALRAENVRLAAERDRARAAEQHRTKVLVSAAHDLTQPVNAARLWLSVLRQHEVSRETADVIGHIERALGTADDFLASLLGASRLEAGMSAPDMAAVPLAPILSALASDFDVQARAKRLRYRVCGGARTVRTDPVLLQRILHNLVANAVRYTSRGGVLVAARRRGRECCIDVHDTGPGISPGEQGAIFEEFRRGSSLPADGITSLGLGLAVVRRLAASIGARVEVASRLGRGSRFRVIVPLVDGDAAHAPLDTPAGAHFDGAFVLVLEPVRCERDRMLQLLAGWSCFAVGLASPVEFRTIARRLERAPDLLIATRALMLRAEARRGLRELRHGFGRPVPLVVVSPDRPFNQQRRRGRTALTWLRSHAPASELRAITAEMLRQEAPRRVP